jgi:hypothetical protein
MIISDPGVKLCETDGILGGRGGEDEEETDVLYIGITNMKEYTK